MVLGLRSKTIKKGSFIHVNYLIQIQEIKPWPPSQSLKILRSVVLQWENGDRSSGFTNQVTPLEGKIEFNESFMLQVTFSREVIAKGGNFHKNPLEFNLYEPRREKMKGQLLGSAVLDLAEHGVLKESVSLTIPLNSKRSFKGGLQPELSVKIQPMERDGSSGSREREGSNKESKDSGLSSGLVSEEEEVEIASFTDDGDDEAESSHSSLEVTKENRGTGNDDISIPDSKPETLKPDQVKEEIKSTTDKKIYEINGSNEKQNFPDSTNRLKGIFKDALQSEKLKQISPAEPEIEKIEQQIHTPSIPPPRFSQTNRKMSFAYGINTGGTNTRRFFGERAYSTLSSDVASKIRLPPVQLPPEPNGNNNIISPSTSRSIEPNNPMEEVKEVHVQEESHTSFAMNPNLSTEEGGDEPDTASPHKPVRIASKASRNAEKVRELELRVELLEGELRDAATAELGLYSTIAEHASSAHKVHTPARRLARLYVYALKNWSKERRAKAARSATSGLVLVAKACGNDVPRLVFWLSNTVVLRAIVSQTSKQSDIIALTNGSAAEDKGSKKRSASLWESVYKKRGKLIFTEELEHWMNPETFISALEKIESWIFSRIVESIWWQIFTPQMQSARKTRSETKKDSSNKKIYGRVTIVGDQQQANLSTEIWKKCFKDSSEKLCPIRACGHECGCLAVLARLVMEQCVARLDVAMFNAILRESDDEMPTDPMSDPITDPKVLPIPSGKSSFGAGVQLKNAIGSWSRFLTDLFGMDSDDSNQNGNGKTDENFVPFRLLNALSDLLMLPKDMLLEASIRKEVCPTFSSSIVKRILDSFVTDDFCPDPIPENVLEALESEDHLERGEEGVRNIPCNVSRMVYWPPPVALVESVIGDVNQSSLQARRNSSSVIRKGYTSDDELDELNSPLTSIIDGSSARKSGLKKNTRSHAIRYQLLQDVWKEDE